MFPRRSLLVSLHGVIVLVGVLVLATTALAAPAPIPQLAVADPLAEPAPATTVSFVADTRPVAEKIVPLLAMRSAELSAATEIEVVVTLVEPEVPAQLAQSLEAHDEVRSQHLAALEHRFVAEAAATGFRSRFGLRHSPVVAGTIPAVAVEELAALPMVRAVEYDFQLTAQRSEGKALLNVPALQSQGGSGDGIGIAILDTGIDGWHDELPWNTKITAWGDFTGTQSDQDAGNDDEGHGTACAGIAAGLNGGVAPEAHLWALKVLDSEGSGNFSWSVQALDAVYESRNDYGGIRVVSMSLGGGAPIDSVCDSDMPSMTQAMQRLVNAGIAVFVASSNDGCSNGIGFPACVSHAISVGAVYDANLGGASFGEGECTPGGCSDATTNADQIPCYSNSGSQLDILAPSHCASTPKLGGGYESCFGGTSAACPYAAGVAAQIFSLRPSTTVSELRQALTSTGSAVTDPRNGITRRRIDAMAAYQALTGGGPGPSGDNVYWVPVAIHDSGAQGSQWRTDVGTLNMGSSTAQLTFTLKTSGQTLTGNSSLASGRQAIFGDIVDDFGISGAGSLSIASTEPLQVTARVFNQGSQGTFGQYLDGVTSSAGMANGEVAWLPHLIQDASFRTNIGVTNTGASSATVQVSLYEYTGSLIGTFNISVPAGQWRQDSEPFRRRYSRNNTAGYARVQVLSGSGIIVYGSVVDNTTSDPTTIPMKR